MSHTHVVVLALTLDDDTTHPLGWSWRSLLDLSPTEAVALLDTPDERYQQGWQDGMTNAAEVIGRLNGVR